MVGLSDRSYGIEAERVHSCGQIRRIVLAHHEYPRLAKLNRPAHEKCYASVRVPETKIEPGQTVGLHTLEDVGATLIHVIMVGVRAWAETPPRAS